MDLPTAIALLRQHLKHTVPADTDLALAMRTCIEQYPRLTSELSSTKANLARCYRQRAEIHQRLRSKRGIPVEDSR